MRTRRTRRHSIILLAALLLAAACRRGPESEGGLSGEWSVHLTAPHAVGEANGAPLSTDGVVVFSRRMHPYVDRPEPPPGTVFGRAYLDFEQVLHRGRGPARLFGSGTGVDMAEEAAAVPDSGGRVRIIIAPEISDWNPELHASVSHDSIRGDWFILGYADTVQRGTFVMTRRPTGAYTDSAFARARRGTRESLNDSMPLAPGETAVAAPALP
jgi:hypothetical protein